MTAEVAVGNKLAIALAADSVATVGTGAKETYDTVNKLFTLSKFQPVGIMVYGNSEFMGFPWETVIKTYRNEKLKEKSFGTVEEYANDFFQYLLNDLNIKNEDSKQVVMLVVLDKLIHIHDDDIGEMEKRCEREIRRLQRAKTILTTGNSREIAVLRTYKRQIDETIDAVFEDNRKISARFRRKLVELAKLAIVKADFSSYMSGVVFAGFGNREIFPVVMDYRVEGIIARKLKTDKGGEYKGDRRSGGFIQGYAQRDMVYRFMEGIDQSYEIFLEGMLLRQIIDKFIELHSKYNRKNKKDIAKDKKEIINECFSLLKAVRQKAREYRRDKFVLPIVNMLNFMPKEELANVAEALVSLTALKRKVSEETETVGGPIDVAVISKGDGFVWIKRKHYFDLTLNQSFRQRYLLM